MFFPQLLEDQSEEENKQWNMNLTVEDVAASLREDFQLTVADSDALLGEESVHRTALQVHAYPTCPFDVRFQESVITIASECFLSFAWIHFTPASAS